MIMDDVHRLVVGPVLRNITKAIPYSPAAHALVLGTGLVESNYDALAQKTNSGAVGVARSFWQIEPATFDDCVRNFISGRASLQQAITATIGYLPGVGRSQRLYGDMALACIMCRIVYFRAREPLPSMDAKAMAAYHKKVYNTALGAADPSVNAPRFQKAIDMVQSPQSIS